MAYGQRGGFSGGSDGGNIGSGLGYTGSGGGYRGKKTSFRGNRGGAGGTNKDCNQRGSSRVRSSYRGSARGSSGWRGRNDQEDLSSPSRSSDPSSDDRRYEVVVDSSDMLDEEDAVDGRERISSVPNERQWDEKKVLAIHNPAGFNIAAAYWEPNDKKMYVMEDTKDTVARDLLTLGSDILVMEQVAPEVIICSVNASQPLHDKVHAYCEEYKCILSMQQHRSFSLPNATFALSQARLPDDSIPVSQERNEADDESELQGGGRVHSGDEYAGMGKIRLSMLKMGSWVNVDAPAAVCAAGGLLTYLNKLKVGSATFDAEGIELSGIEGLSLHQHMLINQDALNSLSIFDVESHAYTQKSTEKKQALSLYGLLNTCVTPAGKRLLHTWHLRPLLSIPAIETRQAAVAHFSHTDNHFAGTEMRKQLKKIGNIARVMVLLRRGRGQANHWKVITEALAASLQIREAIAGMVQGGGRVDILKKVLDVVDVDLFHFTSAVASVVDWDESQRQQGQRRICVRRGVDDALDSYREELASIQGQLEAISREIIKNQDVSFCSSLVVKYIPQLGFFLQIVPTDPPQPFPADWQSNFTTDDTEYFKNDQMRQLDEHYGDLENHIIDREIEIMQDLVERLREVDSQVMLVNDVMAELDCLLAFSVAAQTYNLRRPTMTNEPVLMIDEGRHILQELTVQQYIKNDTFLQGGQSDEGICMKIITGANGSGKSAYGKQVALIVFMAQIGCFVPAEKATVGICDKIYTRLQTKESVCKTGSAFMIDLNQVSHALRGATLRSLLIVDEFGKGTAAADGAGLLYGLINYLIKGVRPRTIVMTHFHELFTQQFLDENLPILRCHMMSLVNDDSTKLVYQYKLVPSMTTSANSFAAECALMNGIAPDVIKRAREVTQAVATFQINSLLDQEVTIEEAIELRESERLAKEFIDWEIDEENDDVSARLNEIWESMEEYGKELRREAEEQDMEGDAESNEKSGITTEGENTNYNTGSMNIENDNLGHQDSMDIVESHLEEVEDLEDQFMEDRMEHEQDQDSQRIVSSNQETDFNAN